MSSSIPVIMCAGPCGRALHPDQRYTYREFVALEQQGTKKISRKTYTGRLFCQDCANPPTSQAQLELEDNS